MRKSSSAPPAIGGIEENADDQILANATPEQLAQASAGMVHGRKRPKFSADDLRLRLRQYDRTPFLELLQHWLENSPRTEDIERLVKRSPDKFISALATLAKIAGFTEKTESTVNINMNISQMSDSQLEDELKRQAAQLGLAIDAEFTPIPPAPAGPLSTSSIDVDSETVQHIDIVEQNKSPARGLRRRLSEKPA